MFKRFFIKLRTWIAIYNQECELAEQLEYRRALKQSMRQAPVELQICQQKINDCKMALYRLRGKIGSPPPQENDHATEDRNVGQNQVSKYTDRDPRWTSSKASNRDRIR